MFKMESDLRAYEQNVYAFKDVFYTPLTNEPKQTFQVELVESDKTTVIASMNQGIILADLSPAPLQTNAAKFK
jgi:hypothetical protein